MRIRLVTYFLFLPCCLIQSLYTDAQSSAPGIYWQQAYGRSSDEQFRGMKLTNDGGFIAVGYSLPLDSDVNSNHNNTDYWIVKCDSAGNIQWQRTYGGSLTDWARSINTTADGGYIVAGFSKSIDGNVTGNHGDFDYWILKLNSTGDILWQRSFGGTGIDNAYYAIETTDGSFVIAGYTESVDGDATGNHGQQDFLILKLNQNGDMIWTKVLGGAFDEEPACVTETNDHGYLITGYSGSNDTNVPDNNGRDDYWVVKLASDGNVLWKKSYGGTKDDGSRWVEKTNDSGFLIAGYAQSNNKNASGNHGGCDYWVIKIDSVGTLKWQKSFGGLLDDYPYCIQRTNDGNYVICGTASSSDGDVTNQRGGGDFWIVKIDMTGNLLWQKSYGGSQHDEARVISQTPDNNLLIAGFSSSSDGDVTSQHGATDGWIVKTCTPPSAIITNGSTVNACKGDKVTLTANSGTGYSYQWNKSGTIISGATTSSYQYTGNTTAGFTVTVTAGCSATSSTTTINRINKPAGIITPLSDLNICYNNPVILQADSGTGYTFKWLKNGAKIANASSRVYIATSTGNYTVKVTNANGCNKTSNPAAVYSACRLTEENYGSNIFASPNPSTGNFVIHIFSHQQNEIAKAELVDLVGTVVMKRSLVLIDGETISVFETSTAVASGTYFLQVKSGDEVQVMKVMIDR